MLYMAVEHYKPGAAKQIYERARQRGRMLPAGVEYLDGWVDTEYTRCFQLMRTDDPALFEPWIEAWADLCRIEVVPVRRSAEAARLVTGGA
jgi:hypothetical protein